jgi:hypothetical protein
MVRHPVQVAELAPWETIRSRDRVAAVDVTVILASMVVALTALTALKVTPVPEAVTVGAVAGGTAHPLPEITTANDLAAWPMAPGVMANGHAVEHGSLKARSAAVDDFD